MVVPGLVILTMSRKDENPSSLMCVGINAPVVFTMSYVSEKKEIFCNDIHTDNK